MHWPNYSITFQILVHIDVKVLTLGQDGGVATNNLGYFAARLRCLAAVYIKVGVSEATTDPEDPTVRMNDVHEGRVSGVQAAIDRILAYPLKGWVQTCNHKKLYDSCCEVQCALTLKLTSKLLSTLSSYSFYLTAEKKIIFIIGGSSQDL